MTILKRSYFLNYPDCRPVDTANAGSEMYIEVKYQEDSPYDFDACLSIFVCTPDYIRLNINKQDRPYLVLSSAIVVSDFRDDIILQAITELLPIIDKIAQRIE